jgi:hypothetical protein
MNAYHGLGILNICGLEQTNGYAHPSSSFLSLRLPSLEALTFFFIIEGLLDFHFLS